MTDRISKVRTRASAVSARMIFTSYVCAALQDKGFSPIRHKAVKGAETLEVEYLGVRYGVTVAPMEKP